MCRGTSERSDDGPKGARASGPSNPPHRLDLKPERNSYAAVAQLDRVPGYEPGGRRFESSQPRHIKTETPQFASQAGWGVLLSVHESLSNIPASIYIAVAYVTECYYLR